jgi:curved DNA-binding protein CbpA
LTEINEAYRILSDSSIRSAYDRSRLTHERQSPNASGNYCAPTAPPPEAGRSLRYLLLLGLLILFLPFLARIIRTPKIAISIAIVLAIAWFGPRLLGKLRRRR